MAEKEWSPYQNAIFKDFEVGVGSTVVQARAGSGKTSTIIRGLKYVSPDHEMMLCAFNKNIQKELEARAPRRANVKTIHAIGFAMLRNAIGKMELDTAGSKKRDLVKAELKKAEKNEKDKENIKKVCQLVSMGKNTLETSTEELQELAYDTDIEDNTFTAVELAPIAHAVIERSAENTALIDFDDMIWLPHRLGLKPETFDVVVVDESQDLNCAQIEIVMNMVADRGRLVAVGDEKQAIYGWRGASETAMEDIRAKFNAKVLPLTVSFRCPKSVVRLAQRYVPDFEFHEHADEGLVDTVHRDQMLSGAQPGDFILSRKNAPLMSICLSFLSRKIPAVVAGRDIGQSLITLAEKSKKHTVSQMLDWLDEYLDGEIQRLTEADKEEKIPYVQDKVEALQVLSRGESLVEDVITKINEIFADDDPRTKIVCSTVHKAKGLQRDRVWVMQDTFKMKYPGRQENNIWYVAITRSAGELHLVQG